MAFLHPSVQFPVLSATDKVTGAILLGVAALLIGYDIYLTKTPNTATISHLTVSYAKYIMTLPLAWGVLTGHLFKNLVGREAPHEGWRIALLAGIGVASVLWDLYALHFGLGKGVWHMRYPGLAVAVGSWMGYFLWPQRFFFTLG
jgi:hypothetical protein